jgi:RNA polymerase sigma-70 factor, ECF subfamily
MSRPDARFEALFRSHQPPVLAYVRRRAPAEIVDDVVNQTFLVAWRRFDRIPVEPLPWLYSVARKTLSDQMRSATRRDALRARLGREPQPKPADDDELYDSPIALALAALSPKDIEAITLIAWEGLTPAQAAEVLGEAPGTFRVRLHRARGHLRAALDKDMTEVSDAR